MENGCARFDIIKEKQKNTGIKDEACTVKGLQNGKYMIKPKAPTPIISLT